MDPMAWDGKEIASMDSDTLAKALKIALAQCRAERNRADRAYSREVEALRRATGLRAERDEARRAEVQAIKRMHAARADRGDAEHRAHVATVRRDEAYRREAVAQAERETLRYALDRATAMLTRTAETDRGGPHGENATRALKEIARILS